MKRARKGKTLAKRRVEESISALSGVGYVSPLCIMIPRGLHMVNHGSRTHGPSTKLASEIRK